MQHEDQEGVQGDSFAHMITTINGDVPAARWHWIPVVSSGKNNSPFIYDFEFKVSGT